MERAFDHARLAHEIIQRWCKIDQADLLRWDELLALARCHLDRLVVEDGSCSGRRGHRHARGGHAHSREASDRMDEKHYFSHKGQSSFGFGRVAFTPGLRAPLGDMDRPKKQKPGTYTKSAFANKAALKVAHEVQLQKAVALVGAGEGGPGKVAGMVVGCTRSQIATAVMHATAKVPFRAAYEIMTKIEMARLVKWCL
eukprot:7376355-Prymnesium_polylepis.1